MSEECWVMSEYHPYDLSLYIHITLWGMRDGGWVMRDEWVSPVWSLAIYTPHYMSEYQPYELKYIWHTHESCSTHMNGVTSYVCICVPNLNAKTVCHYTLAVHVFSLPSPTVSVSSHSKCLLRSNLICVHMCAKLEASHSCLRIRYVCAVLFVGVAHTWIIWHTHVLFVGVLVRYDGTPTNMAHTWIIWHTRAISVWRHKRIRRHKQIWFVYLFHVCAVWFVGALFLHGVYTHLYTFKDAYTRYIKNSTPTNQMAHSWIRCSGWRI